MKHEHNRPRRRFEWLTRLDGYDVDRHQIDPRGWEIVGVDGRTAGEVKDLVVDTERMKARYLDVELDTKVFDFVDDPHVLVPLERAQRDGDRRRLIIDGLSVAKVGELIDTREHHRLAFWDQWWSTGGTAAVPDDWSPSIAKRAVPAGIPSAAAVRRALDEAGPGQQVRVPVVEEELVIERRPVHPDERVTAREVEEAEARRRTER
jgi:sporulation protein YlmC with PRC-barrel domain